MNSLPYLWKDGLDVKVNKAEPSTEIVETQEQVVDDEDFPAQVGSPSYSFL